MTRAVATGSTEFVHPALFYSSDEEYLAALVPFVLDGLADDDPVAVAVPGPRLQLLRGALGSATDTVTMIDMTEAGRNPGWIIPGVLRRFADPHPDRHVRIIGEPIWAGRTATEYPACVQHEALINLAFLGRNVTIVCPYDSSALDERALADARATHPLVWDAQYRGPCSDYAVDEIMASYNEPLNGMADVPPFPVTVPSEIRAARRFAASRARELDLPPDRADDVAFIASELVTNSLMHAQGPCELRIWPDDGHLICEVRDAGQLTDPLAGRRPPAPRQPSGRGLLLVNQLADLVRTHTGAHGTTIRALVRL